MFANERQAKIREILKSQNAVTTMALSQKFGVSVETIRKDLLLLEKNNELVRVHGGAVLAGSVKPYANLSKRLEEQKGEKRELSLLAAKLVQEGDILALDSGSTAIELAEVLMKQFEHLTIVTYSMDVFERVSRHPYFDIILCGGHFLREENAFYGGFTLSVLENTHVSKVFLCPSAVSLKNGICDYQPQLYEIQKKLITIGDEVIVLADSSKYERSALLKNCPMSAKYKYVSDSGLPEEIKEIYRNNDIHIITREDEIDEGFINFK